MVSTVVPVGTKPSNHSKDNQPPSSPKLCAGEQCGKPLSNKGKGRKGGGYERFCPECRASIKQGLPNSSQSTPKVTQTQSTNEHPKRAFDTLSPSEPPLEPKKSRFSASARDFSVFTCDLETIDRNELMDRVRKLVEIGQSCIAELNSATVALKSTEDAFASYKIAFADEAFKALIARRVTPETCDSSSRAESSTLIVTVSEDAGNEEVDAEAIDRLLEATNRGPIPQMVKRKEGKVYISFSDAVQSGRAKSLIETKKECVDLFKTVLTQDKLFPAVALNVDVTDIDALKKEFVFRNPNVGLAIKQVRVIFRSSNSPKGHVKLFFDSKKVRNEVLKSGRLFAAGRRVQVVEVDPNREVRRCFRCQTYGHIAKSATTACSKDEVCGFCAGQHSTRVCTRTGQPKCANCQKAHRSGDPTCIHQIRAVSRYKAVIEQ
jgi:hypothetical protein